MNASQLVSMMTPSFAVLFAAIDPWILTAFLFGAGVGGVSGWLVWGRRAFSLLEEKARVASEAKPTVFVAPVAPAAPVVTAAPVAPMAPVAVPAPVVAAVPSAPTTPVAAAAPIAQGTTELAAETLAMVAAAVHCALGPGYRIQSVVALGNDIEWGREGRRQIFASHQLR